VSVLDIGSIDAKQLKRVIQIAEPSDFDTLERNVADCELCRSEIVDALEAVWWRVSRSRFRLTRSVMYSHRSDTLWGFF
jgi:hypothetical protein